MVVNDESSIATTDDGEPRSLWIPTSVRLPRARRKLLEAISAELRHEDLGETMRLAIDEFVDRHYRRMDG